MGGPAFRPPHLSSSRDLLGRVRRCLRLCRSRAAFRPIRKHSGMSVRRRDNRKGKTASARLRQISPAILAVWTAPVRLSAQGQQPGSTVGALIPADWLPVALGIVALLLVAVGFFLYRRRHQREAPIPLIIDLEALSAATHAPDSKPALLAGPPAELPFEFSPSPANHPEPSLAAPLSSHNWIPESARSATHSTLPTISPAWVDAGTEAALANRTSNGATRTHREDEITSAPEAPARESIELPPLPLLSDTPDVATSSSAIQSAQSSAILQESVESSGFLPSSSLGGEGLPTLHAPRPTLHEGGAGGGGRGPLQPATDLPTVALNAGTEESLQLLPGALEVLEGAEHPTPIRFFRTAALEVAEVTLGRAHGPPYRHIHLWAPSVSRMHACMRFEAGRWKILNLSQTNPLRVNGLVLDAPEVGCILKDGDQLQLGEVVLCYREQRS